MGQREKVHVVFDVRNMDPCDYMSLSERVQALIDYGTIRDAFDAAGLEIVGFEVVEED
jgi:hypothetical protein